MEERQARLELVTLSLGSWCSTNWATAAFIPFKDGGVRSAIKAMDVATKQITLEAKIISINKEDSKNLGINWNWDKIPQNSEDSNNSSNNDDDEDFGGVVHFGASYEFRFNATLNALFANGKAKILATPRIITVPGKEASIFIGEPCRKQCWRK